MIDLLNSSAMKAGAYKRNIGETSAGRPIDWFTNEQVQNGIWREEEIAPQISGLSRPITIYRGSRKTNLIVYD